MKKLLLILGFSPLFLNAQINNLETLLKLEKMNEEDFINEMFLLNWEYSGRFRDSILTQTEEEFVGVLVGIELQYYGDVRQKIRKSYDLDFDNPCETSNTILELRANLRYLRNLTDDLKRFGFDYIDYRQEYVKEENMGGVNYEIVIYFEKDKMNSIMISRRKLNQV